MPDDPFAAALNADPATRHKGDDPWEAALAADPATRLPAAPQSAPGGPDDGQAVAQPSAQPTPPAAPQGPQSRPPVGQSIAATASSQLGANGASIRPFLQQTGQSLDSQRQNWCAAFVNGVLGANGVEGVQGPGKNVATSFMRWGEPVQGDPQPGDVLVEPNGHPLGGTGGHVGIAAGPIASGPAGTFYLMQSGNYAGHVSYSWEPAQKVVARRAPQPTDQAQPTQQAQAQY